MNREELRTALADAFYDKLDRGYGGDLAIYLVGEDHPDRERIAREDVRGAFAAVLDFLASDPQGVAEALGGVVYSQVDEDYEPCPHRDDCACRPAFVFPAQPVGKDSE